MGRSPREPWVGRLCDIAGDMGEKDGEVGNWEPLCSVAPSLATLRPSEPAGKVNDGITHSLAAFDEPHSQ